MRRRSQYLVLLLLAVGLSGCAARSAETIVWKTYLPEQYGDGGSVPAEVTRDLIERVARRFGGCTTTPHVEGLWVDDDGLLVSDRSTEVEVSCGAERRDEARRLAIELGRELRQRAVYFEVRRVDCEIVEVGAASAELRTANSE